MTPGRRTSPRLLTARYPDGAAARYVAVPAAEAYDVAYREALRHVLGTSTPPAVLAEARAALG